VGTSIKEWYEKQSREEAERRERLEKRRVEEKE
jgi:hypothetical protein